MEKEFKVVRGFFMKKWDWKSRVFFIDLVPPSILNNLFLPIVNTTILLRRFLDGMTQYLLLEPCYLIPKGGQSNVLAQSKVLEVKMVCNTRNDEGELFIMVIEYSGVETLWFIYNFLMLVYSSRNIGYYNVFGFNSQVLERVPKLKIMLSSHSIT